MLELGEVLGIGNEGNDPFAALRGLTDIDQLDAVRRGGQLAEVGERLLVIGELEIGARLVAEDGLRCGRLGGGRQSQREQEQDLVHGSTASLYCSRRSSIFDALRSFARRSTENLRSCATKAASL